MIAELVRISEVLEVAGIDEQQDAAQVVGLVPVLNAVEVTSSRPECQRVRGTVSGPAAAGSVARTAPAASLSSGSSVRTSTASSPRTPCGLRDPADHQLHGG